MLKRNEIYLEGYGSPLGLVYFCDDQGHLGFGKLCTFIATLIPFLFAHINRFTLYLAISFFIIEQAWNFLILYDIYMSIHLPIDYKGIVWTPSTPLLHQLYSEGLPSKQESFFMLFGYLILTIVIIPSIYSSVIKYSLRLRDQRSNDEPYIMV